MTSRPRVRRWCVAAVLVALAAVSLWTAHVPALRAAGHWFDVGEHPMAVDYAMPLGGDFNSRPLVAAAMFRAGLAPRVLVPRPTPCEAVVRGLEPAHDEIYRRMLKKTGVSEPSIITLDAGSDSTFEEAQRLRSFLGEGDSKSVAIVTSDFHTRRTRWAFQQVFQGTPHQLHFVSAPVIDFSGDDWWQTSAGLAAYLAELMKLVFYWCHYGPGTFWLLTLLVGLAAVLVLRWRLGVGQNSATPKAVAAS